MGNNDVTVPYVGEMLACEYLRLVLVPRLGLVLDARTQTSVLMHTVRYGKTFVFNYENRLCVLKDVIPPFARVLVIPTRGFNQGLVGNASKANLDDVRVLFFYF
jgi:hypothetical protein